MYYKVYIFLVLVTYIDISHCSFWTLISNNFVLSYYYVHFKVLGFININGHQNSQCHEIRKFVVVVGRMVSIFFIIFYVAAVHSGRRMNTKLVFVTYIYTRYNSRRYVRYEGLWLEAISVLDGGECSASRPFRFILEETTVGTPLSRRLDELKGLVWRFGEEKNPVSCWESNHGSSRTFSPVSLNYTDSGSKTKFKAYTRYPLTTLLLNISKHESRPSTPFQNRVGFLECKGKGKYHPRTGHEGPEGKLV